MKTIAKITGLLVILFFLVTALVYGGNSDDLKSRTITANARGEVIATPDIANFSIGVRQEGGIDLEATQKMHTEIQNRAISILKKNGIKKEDRKTTNYTIAPRYHYPKNQQPRKLTGYTVSSTVLVKLRDITKYGLILNKLGRAGITNVKGPQFSFSNADELTDQALEKAVTRAIEIATIVADQAGVKLGRIIKIIPNVNTPRSYTPRMLGESGNYAAKAPAPVIEAGTEKVTATVTIVYELTE